MPCVIIQSIFMKKYLLMAVLALSALSMSAQEDSKLTVKVGVGLSSVVGSDADTKNAFAYNVGLFYDLSLSEKFSILPGIELVNKAWKSDAVIGTVNMYYAQVPVLAAYKFNLTNDSKIVVKAGPYASYGIFGSDLEYGGKSVGVFDSDEGAERFEAGVLAGISYDFAQCSIGAEYSRAFTKMCSGLKQYHQSFGLTLGYKF